MMASDMIDKAFLLQLVDLAKSAGERIMAHYHSHDVQLVSKADNSPLTAADLASHECLMTGLNDLLPQLPIISEESSLSNWKERQSWPAYFLIDPLDGTKEFIKKNGEFTVNIALIIAGYAHAGVVYAPALGQCYFGAKGLGAWKQTGEDPALSLLALASDNPAHGQYASDQALAIAGRPPIIVGSRSHPSPDFETFIAQYSEHQILAVGSSLKFCLLAEGSADIYPRLGPTSEWDTAAAQAVLEAAGGQVLVKDTLQSLRYNQKESIRNPEFIAFGPQWLARHSAK